MSLKNKTKHWAGNHVMLHKMKFQHLNEILASLHSIDLFCPDHTATLI